MHQRLLLSILFVILWSPGFVLAKIGLGYATPFSFIVARLMLAITFMIIFVRFVKSRYPSSWHIIFHLSVLGILLHAVYLGTSWSAVYQQVPVAIVAIITGLQPLLTGILAGPVLAEKVHIKQWVGLFISFIGIVVIVEPKLVNAFITWAGLGLVGCALLGITLGTLYQKKFCQNVDMRSG
ncbi:MAG TPA: DMT family transporter [Alphaproteobacteria bacterium]|nr:DMT family transporter [Alphaproteobacteria bacterium]